MLFTGNRRVEIKCPSYVGAAKLDLGTTLQIYLSRTADKRRFHEEASGVPPPRLFIANTRPHQAVSSATLAR